jgi:ribonuclease-3
MGDLKDFQRSLGVSFRDLSLLEQALTHRSYLNEHSLPEHASNERLEYLGDALLGYIVAEDLYLRAPDRNEGDLTRIRSELVRRETLAGLALEIGLGEQLRLGKGEEASGGRERLLTLASAFEALVGAILIDSGLEAARSFVSRLLKDETEWLLQGEKPIDAKSHLQEVLQRDGRPLPRYRVVRTEGPEHRRQFTVEVLISGAKLGEGTGPSKRRAEMAAAAEALQNLGQDGSGKVDF